MDLVFAIIGAAVIALVYAVIRFFGTIGEQKNEESSTFFERFITVFKILAIIMIVGYLSEQSGCNYDEEPNYPIKYSPH